MNHKVSPTLTAAKELRGTMTIFIAIVTCVMLFLFGAIFLVQSQGPLKPGWVSNIRILSWGTSILSLGFLIMAKRVFNRSLAGAKDSLNPTREKLSRHRVALIKYLAICEAAAILNIVLFIFTGEFVFIGIAGVMLGFMLAMIPSQRRVVTLLDLDDIQQKELV